MQKKKNLYILLAVLCVILIALIAVTVIISHRQHRSVVTAAPATSSENESMPSPAPSPTTSQPATQSPATQAPTTEEPSTTEEPLTQADSYDQQKALRDAYYTPLVNEAIAAGRKVVYLTFDDGSSEYTPTVIDTLNQYNVHATFFVVGTYCSEDYAKEMYNKILENGNTLGIHSYTHSRANIYASDEAFQNDFNQMYDYVYNLTGYRPWLWRFPGGSSTSIAPEGAMKNSYIPYITSKGMTYYDWNVSSGDGSNSTTSEQVYNNVINGVKDKAVSVVLMHDGYGHGATVSVLPQLLDTLINEMNCLIVPITPGTTPVQHHI